MSNDDKDLDLEVRKLTLQLQQIEVEQERIQRQLRRVQGQIKERNERASGENVQGSDKLNKAELWSNHRSRQPQRHQQPQRRFERPYDSVTSPRRGDWVRILNPRQEQLNIGVVVGFCTDGKVKVQTSDNNILTRQVRNVHHVTGAINFHHGDHGSR